MLKRGNCLPLSTVRSIGVPRPKLSGPALAMKAPLLLFAVAIATAVAPPIRWFSLEQAIATQPRTARFSYKNCSQSALFIIKNITLDPDPPVAGKNLTVTVAYDLLEEVTGGEVKIIVRLGPNVLYSNTVELCDLTPLFGLKCPVPKGPGTNSATQPLPSITPKVTFNITADGTDQGGRELACITFDVKIA